MNKKQLIRRYNWFQRVITYPAPNWSKETKVDFYYRFVEFVDIVRLCGYEFVAESVKEHDKYLLVATDVVPYVKESE